MTIKNDEVERAAAEVAALAGETKTEAIRRALLERRTRLTYQAAAGDRAARMRRFLESEVWPLVPKRERGRRLTKRQEQAILGWGPHGV